MNRQLPFLNALCWQIADVDRLTLAIDRPNLIIDGIDLLAEDLGLPPTIRTISEMSAS